MPDFSSYTELKMYSLMMTANGHVDPRGSMAPPIIMRTAATPMPTPKSSLGPESILGDDLIYRDGAPGEAGVDSSEAGISRAESRRGSSASMEPLAYDQRSLVSYIKRTKRKIDQAVHSQIAFFVINKKMNAARIKSSKNMTHCSRGTKQNQWI